MKKIFFALFAVASVTSMCFAQEASVLDSAGNSANSTQVSSNAVTPAQVPSATVATSQPSSSAPSLAGTTIFTGKVDSVFSGSSMSGAGPQITVKDDKGNGITFIIASDATIIGKDGSPTTLTWIDKDNKVSMEYITNQDGSKTAKSIKVLPD
jgi:hypothetical protein